MSIRIPAGFGPIARLALAGRARAGREDASRLAERRGIASAPRPEGPVVWVHAESREALADVHALVSRLAAYGVTPLVTTGPLADPAEALPDGAIHQYAPVDAPSYARRFVRHWKPNLALVAGWPTAPNALRLAREAGAAAALIDASAPTPARWLRGRLAPSGLLAPFDLCLARSRSDAIALADLGARHVAFAGALVCDAAPPAADPQALAALKRALRGRPVMVAAGACPGEEPGLARAHTVARAHAPDLITIVTPRLPEAADAAMQAAELQGVAATRGGDCAEIAAETEFHVADERDDLALLYRLADVVVMGGSFAEAEPQCPIAPAKLGAPIIHGPAVGAMAEIYATLDEAHGAVPLNAPEALGAEAARLMTDGAARAALASQAKAATRRMGGAIDRTLSALEPYLIQMRLGAA